MLKVASGIFVKEAAAPVEAALSHGAAGLTASESHPLFIAKLIQEAKARLAANPPVVQTVAPKVKGLLPDAAQLEQAKARFKFSSVMPGIRLS